MRRAMLAALSVIALALASPGAALAHRHGHRGHHNKSNARAHHARVHFEHFGAPAPTSPDTPTSSSSEEAKTASPTEVVGMVASFENEVLTIALNDGSTVKGKVTSSTEIECMSTTSPTQSSSEDSSGEDKGSGDGESHEGDQRSSDEEGQSKEDQGDDNDAETVAAEPACGTAALTPGTGVREAELKIGPAGSEFESIELVK